MLANESETGFLIFIFCSIFIELVCLHVEVINFQMQVSSRGAVLPTPGAQPDYILLGI